MCIGTRSFIGMWSCMMTIARSPRVPLLLLLLLVVVVLLLRRRRRRRFVRSGRIPISLPRDGRGVNVARGVAFSSVLFIFIIVHRCTYEKRTEIFAHKFASLRLLKTKCKRRFSRCSRQALAFLAHCQQRALQVLPLRNELLHVSQLQQTRPSPLS